jgi:hypothetical protein
VHLDKEDVTAKLRAEGEHDRALQAQSSLPNRIDPERDAALLHQFDLNVGELIEDASEA